MRVLGDNIIDLLTFFVNAISIIKSFIFWWINNWWKIKLKSFILSFYKDNIRSYANKNTYYWFFTSLKGGTINSLIIIFTKDNLLSFVFLQPLTFCWKTRGFNSIFYIRKYNIEKIQSYKLYFEWLIFRCRIEGKFFDYILASKQTCLFIICLAT